LFDAVALGSWRHRGSLFGFDAATVAVEEGQFMGVEIGMNGAEYRERQAALGPVWQKLIADGDIDRDVIPGVLQRSDHASWLNPVIHADTYYVHALAVKPEFRGKRVGYQLIDGAIKRAKEQGYKRFQLDVLSDNPAVGFYRAVGLELLADNAEVPFTAIKLQVIGALALYLRCCNSSDIARRWLYLRDLRA
jgi:ribosomal protein S18 acetylase RimI-like enzyme